jgi:dTMP kinase
VKERKGCLIVLEGIDGAGTTTQAQRLSSALKAEGHSVRVTREPSDGPVGTMLRLILSGRLVNPDGRAPGWETMALLFAADRMDHVQSEIEPFIASGGIVISDRYDASSLAYQSVSSGSAKGSLDWIRVLNQYARRPDLTLVLDVPSDVAASRREARGEAAQLYEQNEVQRALAEFYRNLKTHIPSDVIEVIDGTRAPEEVTWSLHERVRTRLNSL